MEFLPLLAVTFFFFFLSSLLFLMFDLHFLLFFLLYNIVLVLPYINMNPPQVYTYTPVAVIF